MRLLVVTNMYPPVQSGGYELSCQAFVDHMVKRGATVQVLTARADVADSERPTVFRELWTYLTPSGEFLSPGLVERWRLERANQRAFRAQVESLRPDAVMWWNMGGVSLSLIERARRLGLPAVGVVCDYWMVWSRRRDPWYRAGQRWPAARGFAGAVARVPFVLDISAAARWVFVSDYVRRKTVGELGALARTDVVHSGIPLETYRRRDPGRPWANRLLVVGRVSETKGFDAALRVLGRLPEMRLTIVGSGEQGHEALLRRLIAELAVGDRVTWLGSRSPDEVAQLYAEHDALLFPIRWDEPWGKVPLEAMASGLPVVATPRGGSAEYLEAGVNCLAAMTEDDYVDAIRRLADDKRLRGALVAEARMTAERHDVSRANALREEALARAIQEARAP